MAILKEKTVPAQNDSSRGSPEKANVIPVSCRIQFEVWKQPESLSIDRHQILIKRVHFVFILHALKDRCQKSREGSVTSFASDQSRS